MVWDPVKMTEKLSSMPKVRHKVMDAMLNIGIPFNRWLRYRIDAFSLEGVTIISPPVTLRKNHVGSAHACALALLGEYPAGLLVAQKYPFTEHRIVISSLHVEYKKQGRGTLKGVALPPVSWPELQDGEAFVDMVTEITNEKQESVATVKTRWQVKDWNQVRRK